MLQQTQVPRVIPKYREFIRRFPDFRVLARAPLADVLRAWQGLGYNRRALYLKRIAENVVQDYNGKLPRDPDILRTLPGIGTNTAGSIAAFAFNVPALFIETNIRRAFIHYFFPKRRLVQDATLLPLVQRSLVGQTPREWYSALMDYGAYLGEMLPKTANPNRRSKHYTRQAKFEGSIRQVRGAILKLLLRHPMDASALYNVTKDIRTPIALRKLIEEGMVVSRGGTYRIAGLRVYTEYHTALKRPVSAPRHIQQ
jgi:A/G-specific adenine glycosylase